MVFKLRYYQEDAIKHTFNYINKGGRAGIACLPTGSGKSIIIAEIIKKIMMKKQTAKIMMLTHVKELIEQNFDKIRSIWPSCPAGIYSAGIGLKQFSNPIVYASIQSAFRKPQLFGYVDMIIVDECHLISEKAESMYGYMIAELKKVNPNLVVIGLTATPYRLGMGYLTDGPIFDDIYYDISTMDNFVDLIDQNFLCDLVPVLTDTQYDLSNVKMNGQEFQEKSLDENINRDEITKEIVLETIERTKDRNKGLCFCVSKSHAENMALRFKEAGWSSAYIHSDLTKNEREETLRRFELGEIRILTNVGVLTTGFDAPDIDFIVVSRPTQSTALHVQLLGRGMRPHESKKNTLVLDFAGNTARLGPVNDPVIPPKPGQKGGEAPIRICEVCSTINHASVKRCKECGHEFPPPQIKFSSKIDSTEIIRRKDIPNIKVKNVSQVIINRHISVKGNVTCKVSFFSEGYFYDKYFMFDKSNKSVYLSSVKDLQKLKFKEKVPPFENTDEAIKFIKNNIICPDQIKIWMNKPVKGKKTRSKEILQFIYE